MCSIDANDKQQPLSIDCGSIGGGNALPQNSTTEALFSLSATIDFIYCWLNCLEHHSLSRSNMYFQTMECMFRKITVELPKPLTLKEIRKTLLHAIGGKCYKNKLNVKLPPLKKIKLSKKVQ